MVMSEGGGSMAGGTTGKGKQTMDHVRAQGDVVQAGSKGTEQKMSDVEAGAAVEQHEGNAPWFKFGTARARGIIGVGILAIVIIIVTFLLRH